MSVLKTIKDGKAVAYRLEGGALIIGRGPGCQITVDEQAVLPRHAQVVVLKEGFLLKDLSGKGVLVNGKGVRERLLCEGDVIVIGTRTFTFAGNPGQKTMRLAAESAPPAAAAAPAERKASSTGRVASATGRVASTTTRSTKTVQKAPASTTRSTKKITGRSTARVQKTASFSLPSTKKGRLVAGGIGVGIVGVIALLILLRGAQERPEEIKAGFKDQITTLNKIPPENMAERLQEFDRLLADPKFQRYGGDLYKEIQKQTPKLRESLNLQRAADKDVKPFLARYDAAKADKSIETKAQDLYDEGKSLLDRFSTSSHAAKLTEIIDDLKKTLEAPKDSWEKNWVKLTVDLKKEKDKGDCAAALKVADAFGEQWKEKETPQLSKVLGEQRDSIKRHADVVLERLKKEALKLAADGQKAEAKKQVEAAKPGLEGFPAAAKLAALLKDIDQAKP